MEKTETATDGARIKDGKGDKLSPTLVLHAGSAHSDISIEVDS
jgi:hypothetical protein